MNEEKTLIVGFLTVFAIIISLPSIVQEPVIAMPIVLAYLIGFQSGMTWGCHNVVQEFERRKHKSDKTATDNPVTDEYNRKGERK